MTDDQRNLAEWVAKWAGEKRWPDGRLSEDGVLHCHSEILTDPALAWKAQEELIELCGGRRGNGLVRAARMVQACIPEGVDMSTPAPTYIEATFRALFAARGE